MLYSLEKITTDDNIKPFFVEKLELTYDDAYISHLETCTNASDVYFSNISIPCSDVTGVDRENYINYVVDFHMMSQGIDVRF